MDISENTMPNNIPNLLPLELPTSPTTRAFFSNIFEQFSNNISYVDPPYMINMNRLMIPTLTTEQSTPAPPTPSAQNTYWITDTQDIRESYLPIASDRTPNINRLSTIMEQSFQEKNSYKQIISEEGMKEIIFKKYKKTSTETVMCTITRDILKEGDDIAILPCKHQFKKEAITNWITNKKAECPVCRYKLASTEVKEKEEEIAPRTTYPFSARGAMPIIPRLRNMRQMVLDMINNSIDEEEDEAIQRAIIASLQYQD